MNGLAAVVASVLLLTGGLVPASAGTGRAPGSTPAGAPRVAPVADSSVANFSAALQRLVDLVGAAGGALLALVWARVALSWFSNDVAKKVQAKDRAGDALVGSLIFTAALSGLVWGLAEWVLTGNDREGTPMLLGLAVQSILFAIFGGLTALVNAVLGPTYDHLLVPMLAEGSLYPSFTDPSGFLAVATRFSTYVVVQLVDPAIPLVALALGAIYLARAVLPQLATRTQSILPKFVFAVVLANFSLPVASAILGLAGSGYPVVAGFDGGAWQQWVNLSGPGAVGFSWDNGVLAFVLTLVLFALVLLLVTAIAVRNALLGVLLVLLPLFTILYPIPPLAGLAQRGWTLFGQLAFLPWVVVVPLELAVGSSSAPLLVGYLTVALAGPGLLAMAGAHLGSVGFPSAGSAVAYGTQRNLGLASSAVGTMVVPGGGRPAPTAALAVRGAARTATSVPLPASLPFFVGELAGHAGARLFRHLPAQVARTPGASGPRAFPAVHPPAGSGRRR